MRGLPGGGKMIPFWVYETAAAAGLVVASFRAFCDQRRIAEAKTLELQKAIENHAAEKMTLVSAHNEEKARMEKTIESLRPPTAPTFELSKLLAELNARRHSIEFMPPAAYETDYSNNGRDIKSQDLLLKIFNFVLKHFGETERRLFKSDAGFPMIRLSSNHPNRENTLICLRQYGKKIEELMKGQKTIENKGENKS
jgi:hypothetical protein